ncbi:MAG: hypothetical protein F4188_04705 [Chloroflexi bacterium]|nr:hypothetical protein [Chloroflexota bacterium]MYG90765.1 hypothetical protein [Chloroflexota bacterium]
MDERVFGATGSGVSAGRRRRLRAMTRGYRMRRPAGLALALALWLGWVSSVMAEEMVMSGSRYSAPLWAWIAAIAVAAGLSALGLVIGFWFLRKRSRIESSE